MDYYDVKDFKIMYSMLCESRYFQKTLTAADFGGYMDTGEEAITAGVLVGIRDDDIINNYFRGDGMALRYRGSISLEDQMAWWLGRQSPARPVTSLVPTNYTDLERGVIGATSSCLGGDADLMMGIALAQKMKKTDKIVAFITGDGTLAKGNYHETFTMSALFKLPIMFVIRSNGWAMSTPIERSVAFRRVSDMAEAYQIPCTTVDGNDVLAVRNQVSDAADFVRSGQGPMIIEARTYRMSAHSSHDEDDYRSADTKKHWAAKDPLVVMENIMLQFNISKEDIDKIKNDAIDRVNKAYEKCKTYPEFDVNLAIQQYAATVNHMWGRE